MKIRTLAVWIGAVVAVGELGGCVAVKTTAEADGGGNGSGGKGNGSGSGGVLGGGGAAAGGSAGVSGSGGAVGSTCAPGCTDFPAEPMVTAGVPANAPTIFGAPGSGSQGTGPCLSDPQDGTLFPSNWLRPRFSFQAPIGQSLFEIRLHNASEKNELVVYTTAATWTMPKDMWNGLGAHAVNQPITVTVRGLATAGGAGIVNVSASSTFTIAPVGVGGSIVYWTTTGVSSLKGFKVGDETVTPVMTPGQAGAGVQCIGCHLSTPDGQFIGFAANKAPDHADPASLGIRSGTTLQEPAFLTAAGRQMLARPQQPIAAFSGAHWKAGDRIALSLLQNQNIVWTDLEAASGNQDTGWGIIARTGDTGVPVGPTWSHDGQTIAYTSVKGGSVDTGVRVLSGLGSLYTVPYGDRKGGPAAALKGGDDPKFHAYYPGFSPDDHFVAFTRAPSSGDNYDVPAAEIFLLPRDGAATPTRVAANDPPQCTKRTSPGVTNSWPKWAPTVGRAGDLSYYWLTFSSRRMTRGQPQIFITAITVSEVGLVQTYPALYVWNQPEAESNHTPAWDVFEIAIP